MVHYNYVGLLPNVCCRKTIVPVHSSRISLLLLRRTIQLFRHTINTNTNKRQRYMTISTKAIIPRKHHDPLYCPNNVNFTKHKHTRNHTTTTATTINSTSSSSSVVVPSSSSSSISENNHDGIFRLLNDTERTILQEQRLLTEQARSMAQKVGITSLSSFSKQQQQQYHHDIFQTTFVIVFIGEYNAGKSTLINALLGTKLLSTGSIPTTDTITILSNTTTTTSNNNNEINNDDINQNHTNEENDKNIISSSTTPPTPDTTTNISQDRRTDGHNTTMTTSTTTSMVGDIIHYNISTLPLLYDMTIVDTPGTNAIITDHTTMTLQILPNADLIIFVTSADRPFPESERSMLETISTLYRKNIVVVINKMDILDDTGGDHGMNEKTRVIQFVTDHASTLLGVRPIIIPISAKNALAAKLMGRHTGNNNNTDNNNNWIRSNFHSLEHYLQETLTTETKIKSKLSSPIGVVEGLIHQCQSKLLLEQNDLEIDITTIKLINNQLNGWKKELSSYMQNMLNDTESIMIAEGRRGSILLQRMNLIEYYTMSLFNSNDLLREWEKTKLPSVSLPSQNGNDVQENVKSKLTAIMSDLATSVALAGRAQGQSMIEYLGKRPAMKNQSLLGSITTASQYEETRRNLHDNLIAVVHKHIDMDENEVQLSLLRHFQYVAYVSMALHAGTVIGAMATLVQVVNLLPGMTSCAVLMAFNAIILHVGRTRCVDQYESFWTIHSQRLINDIKVVCSLENDRVCRRIQNGIAPYTLFIESEQERLQQLIWSCNGLNIMSRQLRNRITNLH